MRIVDARTGQLQTIPFALGESGRGRHLEEVRVSNRPGQAPAGPDDVSYFLHGAGDARHVILTRADHRRGLLLRINTAGTYTKGSCGSIDLLSGSATLLVAGQWAEGDAGRIGSGPDQLWHVEGPALWDVILQGGEGKGYGHRYLIVTRSMRVSMFKAEALAQLIATDDDPEVTEVIRDAREVLARDTGTLIAGEAEWRTRARHERRVSVVAALDLADRLDDLEPAAGPPIAHFASRSLAEACAVHGVAIPAVMGADPGGVSGVESGTLVPGTHALVDLRIGPGGGKRYGYRVVAEHGLTTLARRCEGRYETRLSRVDDPAWSVAWVTTRDREPTTYTVADAGGIHTYTPAWGRDGGRRSEPWPGHPVGPMPDFTTIFGLDVVHRA